MIPSVAIVILNYNGKNYLEQFLPSVLASTYVHKKIIVADNNSSDNSVVWLKENYPTVELLLNKNNDGFAGGYNWALQQIDADYFVLLNSDVWVEANWIEPIIEIMEQDATIGACQPKILSWHEKNNFEYAGACGGYIDCLGYPFSRGRIFDVCETDNGQYNSIEKIFWASGAALFISSKLFKKMQGFDASFFAHMEEIDLCWRLQLQGYQICVQPASVVYHVGGGTLPKGYRKTYLNFRNNLLMLEKNLTTTEKFYLLPIRFILDAITAWQGILTGNTIIFRAIAKAHIDVMYRWIFLKSTNNRVTKKITQLNGVYQRSIVWEYYVKRKRKFSELTQ